MVGDGAICLVGDKVWAIVAGMDLRGEVAEVRLAERNASGTKWLCDHVAIRRRDITNDDDVFMTEVGARAELVNRRKLKIADLRRQLDDERDRLQKEQNDLYEALERTNPTSLPGG